MRSVLRGRERKHVNGARDRDAPRVKQERRSYRDSDRDSDSEREGEGEGQGAGAVARPERAAEK